MRTIGRSASWKRPQFLYPPNARPANLPGPPASAPSPWLSQAPSTAARGAAAGRWARSASLPPSRTTSRAAASSGAPLPLPSSPHPPISSSPNNARRESKRWERPTATQQQSKNAAAQESERAREKGAKKDCLHGSALTWSRESGLFWAADARATFERKRQPELKPSTAQQISKPETNRPF